MNKIRCLKIAEKALEEMYAQLQAADGDVDAFNYRTQGGWHYPEDGENRMRKDTDEVKEALELFKELIREREL